MSEISTKIHGSWRLTSFDLTDDAGNWTVWGKDISGLLIYSPDGHMSVSINRNLKNNYDENKDILFYSGTYEVKDNEISHFVTNATSFSRIGTTMLRTAELKDDSLILKGQANSGKKFRLVWKR